MTWEELVYESMMGELVNPIPGVENAFSEGSKCSGLYEQIYAANISLCSRLGVEEDQDVETMINSFLAMNRELCLRSYRLGKEGI